MVAALAAAVVLAVYLVRVVARRRFQAAAARPTVLWELLDAHPNGLATVVSFSTPSCKECGLQARILEAVAPGRVIAVDASARPAVAHAFGVLTAPSTAVLAGDGSLVAVNHGLAGPERLREQIAGAGRGGDRALIGA